MKFLILHVIVLGLIYLIWKSIRKNAAIDQEHARYIFENSDEGGTVRYNSYDEMRRLESRWNKARLGFGLKLIPLGFLILVELILLALSAAL
jgi:hypothetical protein